MSSRLVLGTAQFGGDYGIVNASGRVAKAEAAAMLALARDAGFIGLDTAAAYGDAESVLGRCDLSGLQIVTKIQVPRDVTGAPLREAVVAAVRRSLATLRCGQLDGLLLHSAGALSGGDADEVYAGLLSVRSAGLSRRIGVSVYGGEELALLLDRYPIDLVQLPISVLNQSNRSWLARLSERGIAVHIRSIFLQGVLLRSAAALPETLAAIAPAVAAFQRTAAAAGLTALQAALAFARDLPGVQGIVVGAASIAELRDIIAAFATTARFDASGLDASHIPEADPRNWRRP